jgi:hypothetical protein
MMEDVEKYVPKYDHFHVNQSMPVAMQRTDRQGYNREKTAPSRQWMSWTGISAMTCSS